MEIIFIKNMVCDRCKMVVKNELEKLNLEIGNVELGRVEVLSNNIELIKSDLKKNLHQLGFELLDSENDVLNELIKTHLINYIDDQIYKENISDYLSGKLLKDYPTLSKLFSKQNNITIEKYLIKLKTEKAKQLIQEDKFNFSEIAYSLGYGNLSHLSSQFKKEVGVSLSDFKSKNTFIRKPIDKII